MNEIIKAVIEANDGAIPMSHEGREALVSTFEDLLGDDAKRIVSDDGRLLGVHFSPEAGTHNHNFIEELKGMGLFEALNMDLEQSPKESTKDLHSFLHDGEAKDEFDRYVESHGVGGFLDALGLVEGLAEPLIGLLSEKEIFFFLAARNQVSFELDRLSAPYAGWIVLSEIYAKTCEKAFGVVTRMNEVNGSGGGNNETIEAVVPALNEIQSEIDMVLWDHFARSIPQNEEAVLQFCHANLGTEA